MTPTPKPPNEKWTTRQVIFIFAGCYFLALVLLVFSAILISSSLTVSPDGSTPSPERVILRIVLIALLLILVVILISAPMTVVMQRNIGELVGIPDKHCMVVSIHGQKRYVIAGTSYRSQPKLGETYKLYDLREQAKPVGNSCDTSDQP
jgi:hypothetical protein